MVYSAAISQTSPACLLILVDQSTSMREHVEGAGTKAQFLCDVINRTLATLAVASTRHDGVRDYFDVGVIGYSGLTRDLGLAENALHGVLNTAVLHPLSLMATHPLRIETRQQQVKSETGETISNPIRFPVWVEPCSRGWTGMCAGLGLAHQTLNDWVHRHPLSYPPILLHVTDGHPTDGDPEPIAAKVRALATEDGQCLLFNLHVDQGHGNSHAFPRDPAGLPNKYAVKLFQMSSELPATLIQSARQQGLRIQERARGFVYNADISSIVDFFNIGTRAQLT